MVISYQHLPAHSVSADATAVFLHRDPPLLKRERDTLRKRFGTAVLAPFDSGDFQGKAGELSLVYSATGRSSRRILLVGLGDRNTISLEKYRCASALAVKKARTLKARRIAIALPRLGAGAHDAIVAFTEAAVLSLYRFNKYVSKKENEQETEVEEIIVASDQPGLRSVGPKAVGTGSVLAEATMFARDLANAPGNEIYPETLAKAAVESGQRSGYTVKVLDENELADLKMGGILGVSQGSVRPPRFLVMEYGRSNTRTVVLVGKGVTFDTGGISIKPSAGMAEMKMDMSGAAAVIGTFEAVARLKLPVHVVGLVPAVENMPSGSALRPGDILRHFNGKTSEVDNTDAEGRLILADALSYAGRFKPAAVIDLATLTGACVVALGHHATGMMGNDEGLQERLRKAGDKTYERVWPLPMFDEYDKLIKSDVADVKNVGGRWGGAITAAMFLKRFIGTYRWVHLDIAGTAMLEENSDYTQKGASGVGVRLITEFLRSWR
ncbi:MAG: leucyl aminopeptidase [Bacteroidota bacterium]